MLPTDYEARKALPIYSFLTQYFPDAIVELVKVSVAGNNQHNPGEPLHWARGKSMDQLNTAQRHIFDHGAGAMYDEDGTMHLAKAAWRLLAEVQLLVEKRAEVRKAWFAGSKPAFPPGGLTHNRQPPIRAPSVTTGHQLGLGPIHTSRCDTNIGLNCDCVAQADVLAHQSQGAVSLGSPTPSRK